MAETRYIELFTNPGSVKISEIPVLDYPEFMQFTELLMGEEGTHCVAYFIHPHKDRLQFICCMAADENHAIVCYSHELPLSESLNTALPSLSCKHFQFHPFEREMHEQHGILFDGHPWLKPIRYPFNKANLNSIPDNYPFYFLEGEELHEVGVGPVHAGIIEPGHFRFICHGERVLHLEIQLGYQHRGVEHIFIEKDDNLTRSILAESIAGDTAVGHSIAFAALMESLAGIEIGKPLSRERTIALELERIAIHIGDTAALSTDIAYQFGQVVNEALRTMVINTTQFWCGNRFGKGLVRIGGSNYPLSSTVVREILNNLKEVEERYQQITDRLFSLPSVLGRFEGVGILSTMQATLMGAVGMVARSSGMYRDIRWSHPFAAFPDFPYDPIILQKGDVWSRATLRRKEVFQSIEIIREMLKESEKVDSRHSVSEKPDYHLKLAPSMLAVSMVEGWRGEIVHVGITDDTGKLIQYKAKDPSFHNWMGLALAVRNQEISDFPLCNKSFNLSYCGNDL